MFKLFKYLVRRIIERRGYNVVPIERLEELLAAEATARQYKVIEREEPLSRSRETRHTEVEETLNRTTELVSSPLRLLCVGTGRDGTTSLTRMIQDLYDQEGRGRSAVHEWNAVELYQAFCNFRENGDPE